MAEATLLVKLNAENTRRIDEIIAERMKSNRPISIEHTPEELAKAKEIQDVEGTAAATKYLKEKERARVRLAKRQNMKPSRTAIVQEVLDYILPTYLTLTQ